MASPGIGTIVSYHHPSGGDLPAIVVATPTSWGTYIASTGTTQPTAGEVVLQVFVTDDPNLSIMGSTEGTGSGQYSLLTTTVVLETDDVA